MAALVTNVNDDMLNLKNNQDCQKMLSKMGDNFPVNEKVIMSQKIVKV